MSNTTSHTVVRIVALACALVAGFAGIRAFASEPDAPGTATQVAALSSPGRTVSFDNGVNISISDIDESMACVEAAFPDGSILGSCYPLSSLRTGFAMVTGNVDHDGPSVTVGVVPDDVSAVIINGSFVEVRGNFWIYSGTSPGSNGPVELYRSDGTLWGALPTDGSATLDPAPTLPSP
jgi:hypothetical protein